jgi:oxalate decarboxylase/phosphoglucose isomerase-like protein (cupin superfamily)
MPILYNLHMKNPFAERTHEKMLEVLMTPDAKGPPIHYYMIRGGSEKKNVTVWETGTIGNEYIKAYGHYHITDFKEIYWIVSGEGVLVLQERAKNSDGSYIDDEITYFEARNVKAGDAIEIPPFMGHLLVNTGDTWLVTTDDSPVHLDDSASMPAHADYEPVRKMQGFAYYVVKLDGAPALVRNPRYKSVPDATIT